ncbi:N-acetylated-alpha-linked acidic dipeptidase 2 [Nymphon striatum]|nr:N-acetylated-alpha-linked acidic dipeptidase 2 [Nymphon striatum]
MASTFEYMIKALVLRCLATPLGRCRSYFCSNSLNLVSERIEATPKHLILDTFGILYSTLCRPNEERLARAVTKLVYYDDLVSANDGKWNRQLVDHISADHIKEFLRNLTKKGHLAGTQSDRLGAESIKRTWLDHGIPNVKLNHYDVLLSYPDPNNLNYVSIIGDSGETIFKTKLQEFTEADLDLGRKITPPFNAYSASGTVTGDLIYLNYGNIQDFKYVTEDLGINLKGKIVLMKYGVISRGKKSMMAQKYNASGVILYSDPKDYVWDNSGVYPKSLNIPPDGVQRGALKRIKADPLTAGYPATENAYRTTVKKIEDMYAMFKIPVFPIGYGDAAKLLSEINGTEAPLKWRGGLNLTYNIGPGFKNSKYEIKLNVGNINARKVINNIIGVIPGEIEPDRYVILGNHRDSWTLGASDPSSGTACLMEITRAFGKLYKEGGWRPRRTIIFASWDAEEYGYVGSTEWTEEYRFILDRAVVYFNVDQAVTGTKSFYARGSPSLHETIYKVTKMIDNPDSAEVNRGRKSVYDTWSVLKSNNIDYIPPISYPTGGSDFYPFLHYFGVPVADFRFKGKRLSNPLYHTRFETFDMQNKLNDPKFKYHKALAQVWTSLTTSFSEPVILPFNISGYVPVFTKAFRNLKDSYEELIKTKGFNFDKLEAAFMEYFSAIESFENFKKTKRHSNNPFEIRMINDQMMRMEKSFISIETGVDRVSSLNVLMGGTRFAPGPRLIFGPLSNSLWDVIGNKDVEKWEQLVKQSHTDMELLPDNRFLNFQNPFTPRSCFQMDSTVTYTTNEAIEKMGFGKFQKFIIFFAGTCWIFDAIEIVISSILGPLLVCEWAITPFQLAMVSISVLTGMIIGSPIVGKLCDKYGRRKNCDGCMTCTIFPVHCHLLEVFDNTCVIMLKSVCHADTFTKGECMWFLPLKGWLIAITIIRRWIVHCLSIESCIETVKLIWQSSVICWRRVRFGLVTSDLVVVLPKLSSVRAADCIIITSVHLSRSTDSLINIYIPVGTSITATDSLKSILCPHINLFLVGVSPPITLTGFIILAIFNAALQTNRRHYLKITISVEYTSHNLTLCCASVSEFMGVFINFTSCQLDVVFPYISWSIGGFAAVTLSGLIIPKLGFRPWLAITIVPLVIPLIISHVWLPESMLYLSAAKDKKSIMKILTRISVLNRKPLPQGELEIRVSERRGAILDLFSFEYLTQTVVILLTSFSMNVTYYGAVFLQPYLLVTRSEHISSGKCFFIIILCLSTVRKVNNEMTISKFVFPDDCKIACQSFQTEDYGLLMTAALMEILAKTYLFVSIFATNWNLDHQGLQPCHSLPSTVSMPSIKFSTRKVRKALLLLNISTSKGPDDIPAIVLKTCAPELAPVLNKLFQL